MSVCNWLKFCKLIHHTKGPNLLSNKSQSPGADYRKLTPSAPVSATLFVCPAIAGGDPSAALVADKRTTKERHRHVAGIGTLPPAVTSAPDAVYLNKWLMVVAFCFCGPDQFARINRLSQRFWLMMANLKLGLAKTVGLNDDLIVLSKRQAQNVFVNRC